MKKPLYCNFIISVCALLLMCTVLSAKTDTLHFIGTVSRGDTLPSVTVFSKFTWNISATYKDGKSVSFVSAQPDTVLESTELTAVRLSANFYVDTPLLNKLLTINYKLKGSVKAVLNGRTVVSTGVFEKNGKACALIQDEYTDFVFTDEMQRMDVTYLPYKTNEFKLRLSFYHKDVAAELIEEKNAEVSQGYSMGFYYLAFAIVFLVLFFFLREQTEHLYFSLFCVFAALSILWENVQTDILYNVDYFFGVFCFEFLSIFFCKVLKNKEKSKIPLVVITAVMLLSFLPFVRYSVQNFFGSTGPWLIIGIRTVLYLYVWGSVLYYLVRAIGEKRWEARTILVVCFIPIIIIILLIVGVIIVLAIDVRKGFSNLFLPMLLEYFSTSIVYIYPLAAVFILGRRNGMNQRTLVAQVKSIQALSEENLAKEKEKQELLEQQKESLEKEVSMRTQEVVAQKEEIEKQHGELIIEKAKSDGLLYNILPEEVANELKVNGTTTARHYNNVTVLFTDFVNFTKAGEHMSAQGLIDELHACFKMFDEITSKYGIEKIKTIGDAYLAVCGLPISDPNHAAKVVKAATEINTFMQDRMAKLGSERTFNIRIGIHSGSVVAGIVGVKKFAYDIWGDTVNTAARMEQNSEAGKINISQTTYELVKDKFSCEYRGEVDVKGKGVMKMYYVE